MSLWEEAPSDNKNNSSSSSLNETNSTEDGDARQITALSPSDTVKYDSRTQLILKDLAGKLCLMVDFSDKLVESVYEIADYVPDLKTDEHRKFWETTILPNLKKALIEDVKARNATVRLLSSIGDLATTIQKSGEIVKATKGSRPAIKLARKHIGDAVETLRNGIRIADSLESSAVSLFVTQTDQILSVMGHKAVNFIKQKSEIQNEISKLEQQKRGIYSEINRKKAELEGLINLIHVTESRVHGVDNALKETQYRMKRLQELNTEMEEKVNHVPETVQKETHHRKKFFGFIQYKWKEVNNIANPDKEAQRNYFQSIITARAARIRNEENAKSDTEKVKQQLQADLIEYKTQYTQLNGDIQTLMNGLDEKIDSINKQLDVQYSKLDEVDKEQINVEGITNLKGNALIECLIAVKTFSKNGQENAQVYAPLTAILKKIESTLKMDIDLLLDEEDEINVFIAGNRLLKEVGFLLEYSHMTQKLTTSTQKFDQISATTEFGKLNFDKN